MESEDNFSKRTESGRVKVEFNPHLAQVVVNTVSSDVQKPVSVVPCNTLEVRACDVWVWAVSLSGIAGLPLHVGRPSCACNSLD